MASLPLVSLEQFRIVSYLSVSTLALLAYDYILTFGSEVELIWRSRWNLTKVLFFLTRYSAFVDVAIVVYCHGTHDISQEMCKKMLDIVAWMFLWGIGVAELIIIVRTWAIWGRDRRIGLGLLLCFVGMWATNSYFIVNLDSGGRAKILETSARSLDGCFLVTTQNQLIVDCLCVAALETIVLVLTLLKVVRTPADLSSLACGTTPPLVKQLSRDGLMFYIYLLGISLINIIILLTTSHELSTFLGCLQRSLHSIFSARLLLNLREASLRSGWLGNDAALSVVEWTRNMEHSNVRFAGPNTTRHPPFTVDDGVWDTGRDTEAHIPTLVAESGPGVHD